MRFLKFIFRISAIEALGLSLPFGASNPAISKEKHKECYDAGKQLQYLLKEDIKPSDLMTKKAFENAITVVTVLGGSTNAVLHLLAVANTLNLSLSLDDFQKISNKTPLLADLKPSGKYLMEDLHEVGGLPRLMKLLLDGGLLHGECLTVTGKTVEENLQEVMPLVGDQSVVYPLSNPIKQTGHIQVLYGNVAKDGAVAKITGKEGEKFTGNAKVYDNEQAAINAILDNKVSKGDIIVIRYVGPKGGPGMPEMLKPTSTLIGVGLGNDVALITDGRFSGGSHGFVVGHISPEAFEGGTIALLKDGDRITIDAVKNTINVDLTEKELDKRKLKWKKPNYPAKNGLLLKYLPWDV